MEAFYTDTNAPTLHILDNQRNRRIKGDTTDTCKNMLIHPSYRGLKEHRAERLPDCSQLMPLEDFACFIYAFRYTYIYSLFEISPIQDVNNVKFIIIL